MIFFYTRTFLWYLYDRIESSVLNFEQMDKNWHQWNIMKCNCKCYCGFDNFYFLTTWGEDIAKKHSEYINPLCVSV